MSKMKPPKEPKRPYFPYNHPKPPSETINGTIGSYHIARYCPFKLSELLDHIQKLSGSNDLNNITLELTEGYGGQLYFDITLPPTPNHNYEKQFAEYQKKQKKFDKSVETFPNREKQYKKEMKIYKEELALYRLEEAKKMVASLEKRMAKGKK